MAKTDEKTPPAAPVGPMDFDTFLARLGVKDRTNVTRHIAACEEEPDHQHAELWKKMACALAALAPVVPTSTGQHTLQFFVADGRYRMQVFALDDLRDAKLLIYAPDVLDTVLRDGLLTAPARGEEPTAYKIRGTRGLTLVVQPLDAANTPNPDASFKHMLGWNRKAVRIILPTTAAPAQIAAAEAFCAVAARKWAASIS